LAERATDERELRREEPIEIANEFALVHVCKVHTRNGERLEIHSPRRGRLIRLDPLELEAIACEDDESFLGSARPTNPDHEQRGEENDGG
jgi:hypothetical protein